MVTTDVELELTKQLKEAGKLLSSPTDSVDDLLGILNETEKLLSKVDQSPNTMMLEALHPLMKALVDRNLLKHSNMDVKAFVAACISEITRITAPDAPYDDEIMKDVFQLIVNSLENLSENSDRSSKKKETVLETLSKVRSCVIMLDLECNDLIVEMFEHFVNSIREHHSENIFSWMTNIMVLVLEESEDISIYMLKPLLASVKNNTEGVLPVARKLGETVLSKSAARVRPHITETLKILGDSLDNYSQVLTSIVEGTIDVSEQNDENVSVQQPQQIENNLVKESSNEPPPQADESKHTTASSDNVAPVVTLSVEEGSADKESSKKLEESIDPLPDSNPTKTDTDAQITEKPVSIESNPQPIIIRIGKKSDEVTVTSAKPADSSHSHNEKESEKPEEETEKNIEISIPVSVPKEAENCAPNSPSQSSSLPDENIVKKDENIVKKDENIVKKDENFVKKDDNIVKKDDNFVKKDENIVKKDDSSKKQVKTGLPYERRKRAVKSKKKIPNKDESDTVLPMEVDSVMSDSDLKSTKRGKKKSIVALEEDKDKLPAVVPKEDGKAASGSDEKLPEASKKVEDDAVGSGSKSVKKRGKKVVSGGSVGGSVAKKSKKGGDSEANKTKEDGKGEPEEGSDSDNKPIKPFAKKGKISGSGSVKSSSKTEKGKKNPRGKVVEEENQEKVSSPEDDDMSMTLQSALKKAAGVETGTKRKRSVGKDKVTDTIKYDESLVGLKVEVWWPDDKTYYAGVIESFDPKNKKHKVLYTDGEHEILTLKEEKWKRVDDKNDKNATEAQTNDATLETPKKKKSRTDSVPSGSLAKSKDSVKRVGKASQSGKSKGSASKSAGKSSKVGSKSKGSNIIKNNNKSQSKGKSVNEAPAKETKETETSIEDDDDEVTLDIIPKNKQGARKVANKSKGKTTSESGKKDDDNKDSSKEESDGKSENEADSKEVKLSSENEEIIPENKEEIKKTGEIEKESEDGDEAEEAPESQKGKSTKKGGSKKKGARKGKKKN